MSTATHNHSFSQQSTPTKGKPPLIRIGSRPGSRKGRPIYPTDTTQNLEQNNTNTIQPLTIKLISSSHEHLAPDNTSKENKENHPAFLSPMSLTLSQGNFSYQGWKAEQVQSQTCSPNKGSMDNRAEFIRETRNKGNTSSLQTHDTAPICFNLSTLMPSTVALSSSVCEDKSLGERQFTEAAVEGSQGDLNQTLELGKQCSENQKKVPKWKKLQSVFHSVLLFSREEAKSLGSVNAISQEIDDFTLRKKHNNNSTLLQDKKGNAAEDALDLLRRVTAFCECAAIGSKKHIAQMKELILTDPKRYMWAPDAAEHLLNSCNTKGQTAMYIAAKNGNLDVIKLLIENRANCQIKSKARQSDTHEEIPLEVASRWGHVSVVEYLLQQSKYDINTLLKAAAVAQNSGIKKNIATYIKQSKENKPKRTFSFFICGK